MRGICFGCLRINPVQLRNYAIKDLWSMLKGWDEQEMFNLAIQRKVAIIISETVNRSMGGHGVAEQIMKAFELPMDKKQSVDITPERIRTILARYNENMRKKREQRDKENNG